jgi:transcription initiation factor TFIID subunit 1
MADATPFLNFGDVEAGETISGLYNGLIRAPLFRHKPKTNDFLLVKHTFKNKIKYYLRNIPVIYVSGQTYPITEVPGPHSRKITSTIKNRLQVAAFRLIKKSPFHRLDISSLVKRFPEYSEPQIRQRLKEFTEFHRKGSNSGHWSLKPTIELPDEEKLRQMLTPETICLYESMLAGQRHLQDSGYGRSVEDDDNEESMSKLDIEEQLSPWITTRNFVNASQGKAMLRLYGEGDPTARGEGFNLIRVSMKDIFLREGESAEEKLAEIEARPKSAHRYNVAEQQQIYREEITRIWNAQKNSLGSEADIVLSESDSDDQVEKEFDYYNRKSNALLLNQTNSPSIGMSDKHLLDDDDDISVTGSILSRVSTKHKNKVLTIKRRIRDASGNLIWKSQTVKNTAVIQAYLRNRRIIEDSIARETTQPTTEVERQQLMQKRLRERLDMLKSSSVARSDLDPNTKKASAGGTIPTHLPNKPRKELIRRCGNCGQLGHMKTNRKCPMFKEMNGGGSSPGVSTPDSARNQQDRPASQDPNPHGSNVPSKLRLNAFSANEESNEDYDTN